MTDQSKEAAPAAAADVAQPETIEKDEAAALWAEFDAAESTPVAKDEQFAEEAAPPEEQGAPTQQAEQPEAVEGQKVKEEKPPTPAPDIWANAPPELKAEYDRLAAERARLENRAKAAEGRVSAHQKRINELLKAINSGQSEDEGSKAAREAIEAAAQDYPEVVKPLSQRLDDIDGKVRRTEEASRAMAQAELTRIVEAETAKLEGAHPGWGPLLKSNGETFTAWLKTQPDFIRDAFDRNGEAITDADAAALVVGEFKAHLAGIAAQATPSAQTPPVNTLADKRQRQLAGSETPALTTARPVVSGIPDDGDPEALWKMWDQYEQRQNARA
jgi:hypothetical protein